MPEPQLSLTSNTGRNIHRIDLKKATWPRCVSDLPCKQVSLYWTCWFQIELEAVPSRVTVSLSSSSGHRLSPARTLSSHFLWQTVAATGREVSVVDFNETFLFFFFFFYCYHTYSTFSHLKTNLSALLMLQKLKPLNRTLTQTPKCAPLRVMWPLERRFLATSRDISGSYNGEGAPGTEGVRARTALDPPMVGRTVPTTKTIRSKLSRVHAQKPCHRRITNSLRKHDLFNQQRFIAHLF